MCCGLSVVFKITTRHSTIDVRKKSDLSRKNRTTGSPAHVRKIWDWPHPGLKYIFMNENIRIVIEIWLKLFPKSPINNISTLVQIMVWHHPGDKPLSESMMVRLLMHICITGPQSVIALPEAEYKLSVWTCKTPHLPYLTFSNELLSIFCAEFRQNVPCYNGTTLYFAFHVVRCPDCWVVTSVMTWKPANRDMAVPTWHVGDRFMWHLLHYYLEMRCGTVPAMLTSPPP